MSIAYRKVFRDLWSNKARTALVVLSIAVGVMAVGMIFSSNSLMDQRMTAAQVASSPSNVWLFLRGLIDDDGIASIEMFEAVGRKYWPTFFATLRDRLKPGRVAALQIITMQERRYEVYRRGVDFMQKYIFPGGMLPSPTVLRREVERAGLARGVGRNRVVEAAGYAEHIAEDG